MVSGREYLKVGYGLDVDDLWRRNFVVLICFMFFFQLTQVILIEYFPVSQHASFLVSEAQFMCYLDLHRRKLGSCLR